MERIRVGIVGGTGYGGIELMRLLLSHPQAMLHCLVSRSEAGRRVDAVFPHLRGHTDLMFEAEETADLTSCDLVFFATPNGVAMRQVPVLLENGVRVIDLAADFRLRDPDLWARWYGEPHACPELLQDVVYGLPELNRDALRDARLVANPGCYPTAVILAFLPLLRSGAAPLGALIADAKSGVSGAGRRAVVGNLLAELSENFKAYGVSGHRHLPEIKQALDAVAGQTRELLFVPHVVPMIRGIHATCYAQVAPDIDVQALYEETYQREPFVDVLPQGSHPETASVRGVNLCRIALHRQSESGHVIVLSVIDNLVKGAAGQAVQNMNLMFGLPEDTGLRYAPVVP
ncbi:N-acetyl-gamma-glutamyl-phosphate reductase [Acidihalobacter aeolianus]|uniref:N-acetyl-gamma-glutamyl-phosphate reductase n=1 Tax=Acidihalobacter aeolianus TaxID=2792603 RepID=A0A1D8KCC4_9GAMM|nr:N-acetyl-gamma-glutamyl-phosphate reductase [Acidihalobacter aeolianus]AOV18615.1 N-acetyl-gamma-glutamyl-phosphate reductase [Acidihalobacter aeolianus]